MGKSICARMDGQYPHYLQILAAEKEAADFVEKNRDGKILRVIRTTRSLSGEIDIITVPESPVNIGDEFTMPLSVIRILSVGDSRPAKGDHLRPDVQWLRCGFEVIQKL